MKMIQKVLLNGILVMLPLQLCAMQKPATSAATFEEELEAQGDAPKRGAWNLASYVPAWLTGRRAAIAGASVAGIAALAIGGKIGYNKLKDKYTNDNEFQTKVDDFTAGVKNHKGKIIGGTVGAVALVGLGIAGWKWYTSRAEKAALLDLMKSVNDEDDAVEVVPDWLSGLNALLTAVGNEAQVENLETWKATLLKRAYEERTPYFLLNDAKFVAQMTQPGYKTGLVNLIGLAEADQRLELASVIAANHEDNAAIAALIGKDFFAEVMINPAVLLKEPFRSALTREEREQVNLAVDLQQKKAKRITRFVQENDLMPAIEAELESAE